VREAGGKVSEQVSEISARQGAGPPARALGARACEVGWWTGGWACERGRLGCQGRRWGRAGVSVLGCGWRSFGGAVVAGAGQCWSVRVCGFGGTPLALVF
jgi:hypothetical protein